MLDDDTLNIENDNDIGNNTDASLVDDDDDDEFYTPGPDVLYDIRKSIADFSLNMAKSRLQKQYEIFKKFDSTKNLLFRRNLYSFLNSNLSLQGNQIISDRFTSSIKYNKLLNLLTIGSWNGNCYIVDPLDLSIKNIIPDLHDAKLSGLDWNSNSIMATGGNDGLIKIISNPHLKNYSILSTLSGHLSRINSIKFHPMNNLITSASNDLTWRLWDIEKSLELYYQEGHTESVNTLSYNIDGSILASAGNDSIIKLWDLRSGKSIFNLEKNGHIKSIHSLDWRNNGYQLASGGSDSQLIIWDIRMCKKLNSVLAHNKLISNVKFSSNGNVLTSTGYDGNLSLTACDSWVVFKKFQTLDKIMACDIWNSDDNDNNNDFSNFNIVTGGWDRGIKLYNTKL